jgi:hypothetical protein
MNFPRNRSLFSIDPHLSTLDKPAAAVALYRLAMLNAHRQDHDAATTRGFKVQCHKRTRQSSLDATLGKLS